VSIVEHGVFECLTEPNLLCFAGASEAMAPSSTTPTSLASAASAAITLSTFSADVVAEWKSLFALPMLRSVSSSPVDVAVDEISHIPAAF
jgi:hypothetical protein